MKERVLLHASEVLTGQGVRRKDGRGIVEEDLERIEDGAVVYDRRILWVGPTSDLPKKYLKCRYKTDLKGRQAVIPGLTDCHTHLVFAGDRSSEFSDRCAGVSYQEIARRGGGILSSVRATRAASEVELEKLAIPRVKEAVSHGVRTIEIKSGYGLDLESELKILRVVAGLKKRFPNLIFRSTFLGAHAIPPELSHKEYVSRVCLEMLPAVAKKKLADSCDVFVDEGYFTVQDAEAILNAARDLGMKIKIHADELGNTSSAQLAARMDALSADHLLRISEEGIRSLAASETVAVLLPGTAFYLKAAHAPARKLLDAGARVALATDFNPGTCMTLSLPSIMTLGALYLGMTRAELFASVTYNSARALGLHRTQGTLEKGMRADLVTLPFTRFDELYYRFAWSGEAGSR